MFTNLQAYMILRLQHAGKTILYCVQKYFSWAPCTQTAIQNKLCG